VLADKDVEVTNANFDGLSLLCDEFRFAALCERLSAFRQSADFKEVATMGDSEARLRLSVLEERLLQRDHEFAALRQAQESTAAALADAIVRLSRIETGGFQVQYGTEVALTSETELGRSAVDVLALQSWRESAAEETRPAGSNAGSFRIWIR
jgi:hypothetical protein